MSDRDEVSLIFFLKKEEKFPPAVWTKVTLESAQHCPERAGLDHADSERRDDPLRRGLQPSI